MDASLRSIRPLRISRTTRVFGGQRLCKSSFGTKNCKLERVQQYRWGCAVRKPTGLLHCNLPFFTKSLYEHAISVPPPSAVAIGKKGDQFQTAEHKEYHPLFGKALAYALGDGLLSALRRRGHSVAAEQTHDTLERLTGVAATSASLREASSFLPDFQGR